MINSTIHLPENFVFGYHKTFNAQRDRALLDAQFSKSIQLNFSKVRHLDSAALGMLVLLHKRAAPEQIKLSIVGALGNTLRILTMTKMHKYFEIHLA